MTFRGGPDLDLGVIGIRQVAGLVDRLGRLVWGCLPRMDADPAFSAPLTPEGGDADTGVFAIDLQDQAHVTRSYLRNTAVLETILDDGRGNVMSAVLEASWVVADRPMAFMLGRDETLSDAPLTLARQFPDYTREYWQDWIRGLAIVDAVGGEPWGNFPQTYSMVGIINCAVRLSRPWEDVL